MNLAAYRFGHRHRLAMRADQVGGAGKLDTTPIHHRLWRLVNSVLSCIGNNASNFSGCHIKSSRIDLEVMADSWRVWQIARAAVLWQERGKCVRSPIPQR